jgi:hypothetical protein
MLTNAAYSTYSLALSEADIADENLVQTGADFRLKVGDSHLLCSSQHEPKSLYSQANKPH